jgi:hypothetical protein
MMTISLKQGQALAELADRLYPFLPGTPHPYADQNLSFPGVAAQLGLHGYWPGGSKRPAITTLLRTTLEQESSRFCPLILAIVQNGIAYRMKRDPVSREEIDALNVIIGRIGYKISDLHDEEFLKGLPSFGRTEKSVNEAPDQKAVAELQAKVMALQGIEPVQRGFAFEVLLSRLFNLYRLAPRGSFRITGEQIGGSFALDREIYLLEARWRNEQSANSDLLIFSGKVAGKAEWSRGLFVSYAGFSKDGLLGFGQGRRTNIIGLDGLDLYHILSGSLDLREVLRRKMRRAAETNQVYVPVRELFAHVM